MPSRHRELANRRNPLPRIRHPVAIQVCDPKLREALLHRLSERQAVYKEKWARQRECLVSQKDLGLSENRLHPDCGGVAQVGPRLQDDDARWHHHHFLEGEQDPWIGGHSVFLQVTSQEQEDRART